MVFKAYFDGGNQADSTQYDVVTLASVIGVPDWWRPLEREWQSILKRHHVAYVHTTDLVTLSNLDFTSDKNWTRQQSNALLDECVSLVEKSTTKRVGSPPDPLSPALVPCTITIVLKDFRRMQAELPDYGPQDATEVCCLQSMFHVFRLGERVGTNFYHLYFDQNEPFYRHAVDRWKNKKAKKILAPFKKVVHCGESNARDVPALQMADLFAWCVSHKNDVRQEWHGRVLSLYRIDEWLDYEMLSNPEQFPRMLRTYCKLPKHRPTR